MATLLLHLLAAALLLSARGSLCSNFSTSLNDTSSYTEALVSCARRDCTHHRVTWQNLLNDEAPCMIVAGAWWSAEPARMPVTLVTQLSVDRLNQLKAQCRQWQGPLAAAVHLALLNPSAELSANSTLNLDKAKQQVQNLFDHVGRHQSDYCQLRIMLLYDLYADEQAMALYPVNSLRNYARLMSDTSMIANIDVDMLPSTTMSESLKDPDQTQELLQACKQKQVFVIPAFHTNCYDRTYADNVSKLSKEAMKSHAIFKSKGKGKGKGKGRSTNVRKPCLRPFQHKQWKYHGPTNFEQWYTANQAYPANITTWSGWYEPWYISHRIITPWYDIRYKGYGKNKIIQTMFTRYVGFKTMVHPAGFLVHRPHESSKARDMFLTVDRDSPTFRESLTGHIDLLFEGHKLDMAHGTYTVVRDGAVDNCLQVLDWWQRGASRHHQRSAARLNMAITL